MITLPAWQQDQPPWQRVGRLAAPTGTNISKSGNALLLQPLPTGELRLPRTWMGALESPGVAGCFARGAAWRRAADSLSSGGRLVVAVLGAEYWRSLVDSPGLSDGGRRTADDW